MMLLQPQVTILDKFVIQQESIPNLITPIGIKHNQIQINSNRGTMDVTDSITKNVSIEIYLANYFK